MAPALQTPQRGTGKAPLKAEVVFFGLERALPGRGAQRGTVSLDSIPDKSRQPRAAGAEAGSVPKGVSRPRLELLLR